MARQLTLIEARRTWRLDERTKAIGRRGIAEARAALAAHRPQDDGPHDHHRDDGHRSAA